MSSFIGCKISLISKAGIRYEGILYTIDPKESTVALSKVKSYGTEDRKVQRIIPARDEVYEYIIFRGSDIQDLNVVERSKESTLLMEDSAIVRAEMSTSGKAPAAFVATDMATDEASSSPWRVANGSQAKFQSTNGNKAQESTEDCKTTSFSGNHIIDNDKLCNENTKYESRNYNTHKSDTMKNMDDNQMFGRPSKLQEKNGYNDQSYGNYYNGSYKHRDNGYRNSSDYGFSRDYNKYDRSTRDYNDYERPSRGRRDNYRQERYFDNYKSRGFESSEYGRDCSSYSYHQYEIPYETSSHSQRWYVNLRGGPSKSKNRTDSGKQNDASFKEDYDFEGANALIAKELADMVVHQVKTDLEEDATEIVEGDTTEICDENDEAYYDKDKSFYDNISSEMMDRANGKIVRPMNRKEERKINVETFGVAESTRSSGRNSNRWSRGGGGGRSGMRSGRVTSYVEAAYRGSVNEGMNGGVKKEGARGARGSVNGRKVVDNGGPGRGDGC